MLEYKLITKEDVLDLKRAQQDIFPNEDFSKAIPIDLTDLDFIEYANYYLVYDNKELVGMTGIYVYKDYLDEAWLGWFGVMPEKRNKGYGKRILTNSINYFAHQGFAYMRLYTSLNDNFDACKLYHKMGMKHEAYWAEANTVGCVDIFSLALQAAPDFRPLNNRMLYLDKMNKIILGE